jgi:F-type H+-transporting ATPase subunit delta
MVKGSIGRRWAKALFAIGEEQGTLVGLVREVQRAADVWAESEELRTTLVNPLLAESTRFKVWEAVIRRLGVSAIGTNFFRLLFEKGRLAEIPAIARELHVLTDEKDNRLRAEVIGAGPVPETVVQQLRAALQRQTGRAVVVTTRQDPSLIGGIVTRVGDLMYDGSIRAQLARIKEGMLGRA